MINFEMPKFKTASEAMAIARTMFGRPDSSPKGSLCKWASFGTQKGLNPHDVKKFIEKAWDVWKQENEWLSSSDLIMKATEMEKFMNVIISNTVLHAMYALAPKSRKQSHNFVYFWESLMKICDLKIQELSTGTGKIGHSLGVNQYNKSSLASQLKKLEERVEILEQKLKEKEKIPVQKSFNPGQFYGNTP